MNQNNLRKNISTNDPFVRKFLERIPPHTSVNFTDTQLAELKRVFQNRIQPQHSVDIRLSIPVLKRRFYLVFLMGKEQRRLPRLQTPVGKPANQLLLRLSVLVLITSLLATLYMVHQRWGIDKVSGQVITKSMRVLLHKD